MFNTQYLNKDDFLIEADKLEEERLLLKWVNENPIIQKAFSVDGKKLYLYKSEDVLDLGLNLQI